MSFNLHDIVRPAIGMNYADEDLKIYRSIGQKNDGGLLVASYAPAEEIKGNFQSEGDSVLDHANLAGQNTIVRKLYLYATDNRKERPWSMYRPLARSGDYIEDSKGGMWFVSAVTEDFSDVGWECVRCVFQQTPCVLNIVDENDDDNEPDPEL